MEYKITPCKAPLTDQEILEDIQRVAEANGEKRLTIAEYRRSGNYSQTAIQNHFGTWNNALRKAGVGDKQPDSKKKISGDDYAADFRRVAGLLEKDTVSYAEYIRLGSYSAGYVFERFETWDAALISAGLQPTGRAKHKIGEQALFEEIEKMWMLLGRQPTSTDVLKGNLSQYSLDTYKRRFGSWRKALEAFAAYQNGQGPEIEETMPAVKQQEEQIPSLVHSTSRNVSQRLRFRILKRDHYKCCACGASPAKDPAVELHVDHIIPWSKGGETVEENLQTLCSKCNQGKSNL